MRKILFAILCFLFVSCSNLYKANEIYSKYQKNYRNSYSKYESAKYKEVEDGKRKTLSKNF